MKEGLGDTVLGRSCEKCIYKYEKNCPVQTIRQWVIDNSDKGTISGNTVYRQVKIDKVLMVLAKVCVHYKKSIVINKKGDSHE